MSEAGQMTSRFPVQYFDGINSTVQSTLAKRTEIFHAENARSPQIGVLEKRQGQVVKGLASGGGVFTAASANSGLFYFENLATNKNLFRVSKVGATTSIYSLNNSDQWTIMGDSDATSLSVNPIDTTNVDGQMFIVNGTDSNRYIENNGTTIKTSAEAGHLYNSPIAKKIVYYKNRIHLADFTKNSVRYPTTIVRSSYPLGIIALADGDHDPAVTEIKVTESKYFYAAGGVNEYDVYRGGTFIEKVTVTKVNETSIEVNATTNHILSADELWPTGTYTGAKLFRWVNNPSSTGNDVKQYDTFKMTGGDNSPITLFETIGNILMIGNKNNLATWDDYTLTNLDLGIGASSDRGHTKLLGTLYFIDYSGIYGTTGGLPTLLSRKVERYIKGATKQGLEASIGGVKGLSVFFTLGDVTLYKEDGSLEKVLKKVTIEYSVADQNWYVHTNVDYNFFINFKDTNGEEKLYGTSNIAGFPVASFLEGTTDFGSEIFLRVDTQEIQLMKEFETFAAPIEVVTEVDRGSQLQCYVSLDRKRFFELSGTATKGVSILKLMKPGKVEGKPPHCRRIQLSYRDGSKQLCRINQFAINYLPTTITEQHE